jgi:hypothetical protein
MNRILRRVPLLDASGGHNVIWTADGTSAVRRYDSGEVVVVGPHVYTLDHVVHVLMRGAWYDGQFRRSTMPEPV